MHSNQTTEFSFILKPSQFGVGVFAMHPIKKGALLRLFGNEKEEEHQIRILPKKDVPKEFQEYCLDREGGKIICPLDFGAMPVGWYLNHSSNPNIQHQDYNFYASKDIKAGEELLVDYNSLEEPEATKDDYYK